LAFLWTLVCVWILLAGPSTESATYILAALPVAWLIIEAAHDKRSRVLRLFSLTAFAMLLIGTGSSILSTGRAIKTFGWQPEGAILLLLALVIWRMRSSPAVTSSDEGTPDAGGTPSAAGGAGTNAAREVAAAAVNVPPGK
jgi:hypothetical protein